MSTILLTIAILVASGLAIPSFLLALDTVQAIMDRPSSIDWEYQENRLERFEANAAVRLAEHVKRWSRICECHPCADNRFLNGWPKTTRGVNLRHIED